MSTQAARGPQARNRHRHLVSAALEKGFELIANNCEVLAGSFQTMGTTLI